MRRISSGLFTAFSLGGLSASQNVGQFGPEDLGPSVRVFTKDHHPVPKLHQLPPLVLVNFALAFLLVNGTVYVDRDVRLVEEVGDGACLGNPALSSVRKRQAVLPQELEKPPLQPRLTALEELLKPLLFFPLYSRARAERLS